MKEKKEKKKRVKIGGTRRRNRPKKGDGAEKQGRAKTATRLGTIKPPTLRKNGIAEARFPSREKQKKDTT